VSGEQNLAGTAGLSAVCPTEAQMPKDREEDVYSAGEVETRKTVIARCGELNKREGGPNRRWRTTIVHPVTTKLSDRERPDIGGSTNYVEFTHAE
jgi:hypothetical protein